MFPYFIILKSKLLVLLFRISSSSVGAKQGEIRVIGGTPNDYSEIGEWTKVGGQGG